jgi:hypothetical protein
MRLYNTGTSPEVVGGWSNPAIFPGEGRDFDEETAAYLLSTGRWSQEDPRAGLEQEQAFKERRREEAEAQTDPASPADQGAPQ